MLSDLSKIKEYFKNLDEYDYHAAMGINEISKALKKNKSQGTLESWIEKK